MARSHVRYIKEKAVKKKTNQTPIKICVNGETIRLLDAADLTKAAGGNLSYISCLIRCVE